MPCGDTSDPNDKAGCAIFTIIAFWLIIILIITW